MAAGKKNTASDKADNDSIKLGLFDRPLTSGSAPEKFTFYDYLTFKNIVIGIGIITFLIFLGSLASPRTAALLAGLAGLLGLMLMEISARRRWERSMLAQFQQMSADYERLVREVARNRNDTAGLRKKLSDAAGSVMRSYEKPSGDGIEQRMVKTMVEQISRLSDISSDEPQGIDEALSFDLNALENDPSLRGIGENEIGRRLTDEQVLGLINAAIKKDHVDLYLQPIVTLPQRKLRFYEMFSRIRIMPDVYLPATRYIELAMKQDLVPVIDNLLLLRGLQVIRNTAAGDYNRAFFFNVTSLTLNDPKFMGDLVEFIAQNRPLAPQLIFEMGQGDFATMNADVLPTFDGLSKLGCRFSMDQVRDVSFDFHRLESSHVRFIKIDSTLLLAELKEPGGLQRLKRMKAELDRRGIDIVVEKIETDRQLLELLDMDIDYGQGYLFGKPTLYEKM